MQRLTSFLTVPVVGTLLSTSAIAQGAVTDVGTPRSETLIVQTFDGRSSNPTQMNPLNRYAHWRGFRELAWGYLWEMDTATGDSYPELADGFPEVLNDDHTKFRVKIRDDVLWSDGERFTTDDMIYTIDTAFKYRDQLSNVTNTVTFLKDWKKIDDHTIEIETVEPAYDFVTRFGVYTWGSHIVWLPEHVFAPLGDDVVSYENNDPVVLGPYTIKEFDPNGFWQLWERRDDWERSGWGGGSRRAQAQICALQGLRHRGDTQSRLRAEPVRHRHLHEPGHHRGGAVAKRGDRDLLAAVSVPRHERRLRLGHLLQQPDRPL